jgi:hypothetical protein
LGTTEVVFWLRIQLIAATHSPNRSAGVFQSYSGPFVEFSCEGAQSGLAGAHRRNLITTLSIFVSWWRPAYLLVTDIEFH